MTIRARSRRTNIITAYVIAVLILFFGRQHASNLRAPASEPVTNALIFISDTDSIDAGRGSNSVYRIKVNGSRGGVESRGHRPADAHPPLKRLVGSIPHGDGYLRTSDIDCERASQQLVIASQRHDLNGFHHAMLDGSGLHLDKPKNGAALSATRQIAIAPDGRKIVISRQDPAFAEPRFGLVGGNLFARHFRTVKAASASVSYRSPDWSPGGKYIAYIIERHESDSAIAYQLAIAQASGANEYSAFETKMTISDLDWSPDGRWLALEMNRMIYKLRPDGSDLTLLSSHHAGASSPRWSPDSERISFVAPSSFRGFHQLMVMDADGGNIKQVANIRGDVANGCWV